MTKNCNHWVHTSDMKCDRCGKEFSSKKEKIWTLFQKEVPCKQGGCNQHYACHLWETGWRVGLKKFWFIKWLEFTR